MLTRATFDTFERLLSVMGEEADVVVRRRSIEYERAGLALLRSRSPSERFELALSWNRLAGEIAQEGGRARRTQS